MNETIYGKRIILSGGVEVEITARHQAWAEAASQLLDRFTMSEVLTEVAKASKLEY